METNHNVADAPKLVAIVLGMTVSELTRLDP